MGIESKNECVITSPPFAKVTYMDVLMSREAMDDVHGRTSVAIGMDADSDCAERLG